jgi:cephalosporin hydroxylase
MKLHIDTERAVLHVEDGGRSRELPLYSREAFEHLSELWIKVGWNERYSYTFTWMGRPIVQLPEDVLRIQEVIWRLEPDIVLETGVAHGGSLVFYAGLCEARGRGKVIGVDIEIRAHNRAAIESHPLSHRISLIEGNSVAPTTLEQVRGLVGDASRVLVLLDSCHTKAHVAAELEAYHGFVTPGSYIVATDGIMKALHDVPSGQPTWSWDNPTDAAAEFAQRHPEFVIEQPAWAFCESKLERNNTYWPGAYLRRA